LVALSAELTAWPLRAGLSFCASGTSGAELTGQAGRPFGAVFTARSLRALWASGTSGTGIALRTGRPFGAVFAVDAVHALQPLRTGLALRTSGTSGAEFSGRARIADVALLAAVTSETAIAISTGRTIGASVALLASITVAAIFQIADLFRDRALDAVEPLDYFGTQLGDCRRGLRFD
jgi:hypothetical protein